MTLDSSILKEFIQESKLLINESLDTLELVEGDPKEVQKLEVYGNTVDRIMGGAKNLAMLVDATHQMHFIGDYCGLCKAVGYKSSQIKGNDDFLMICVALLLDATETLKEMINKLSVDRIAEKNILSKTFLERLQWVSSQFGKEIRDTVGKASHGQEEIDVLLKKLGVG